MMKELEEL